MGELPGNTRPEFESFAETSFPSLVVVLVRVVHDAALAYDLATETIAAARWRWPPAPRDDHFAWLIEVGASVLADAAGRTRVPSVERRRRTGEPPSHALTIADQQEIARLADAHLELTPATREVGERLARSSPPPHILREIDLSGLVSAQALPDRERDRRDS